MSTNRTPIPVTDLEPHSFNDIARAHAFKKAGQRVSIHVHSIRKRLCDPDGISAKAAIDALVEGGILVNDSPEFVKEVTFSQEKGTPERTIISIQEITTK